MSFEPCSAQPPNGEIQAEIMADGQSSWTSVEWTTRPGYFYDFESSDDLVSWEVVSSLYGAGHTVSVPVVSSDPSGGGGGGATSWDEVVSAQFTLHWFPDGKSLVSWHDGDQAVSVVEDLSFAAIGSYPVFVGNYESEEPDPLDPSSTITVLTSVGVSVQAGIWSDQFDDGPEFDPSSLSVEQAGTLAVLVDHYSQLHADLLDAISGQGGDTENQVQPPSTGGGHNLYRIVESEIDSDGDKIPDWRELELGTNPFLSDSDGDFVDDLTEIAQGSNPNDSDTDGDGEPDDVDPSPNGPVWKVARSSVSSFYESEGCLEVSIETFASWNASLNDTYDNYIDPPTVFEVEGKMIDLPQAIPSGVDPLPAETIFELNAGHSISESGATHSMEGEKMRLWLTVPEARGSELRMSMVEVVETVENGGDPTYEIDVHEAVIPAEHVESTAALELSADIPAADTGDEKSVNVKLSPVHLRVDTNRDGVIDSNDDAGRHEFTNERGAVYVVNYDHDEGREDGRPLEDAVKWKATDDGEEDGVKKRKLQPQWEDWKIDIDDSDQHKEDVIDLTPLHISVPSSLPETTKVFLKVKDEEPHDAKAFHMYVARFDGSSVEKYEPIWGGLVEEAAPEGVSTDTEVDITKWVNENAADYDDTRASEGIGDYKLYLEGIIFRSMPFPGEDGYARYDGTTEIFDGDIEIGIELRDGGTPKGNPAWVKLSHCGVEPQDPDAVLAFEGHDDPNTAQGFGKYSKGGRYGHLYTVTTNGDSADKANLLPTMLRYAIESPVPRTIVFALEGSSGRIALAERLRVKDPRLTIAGQTAFANGASGMCIENHGLEIEADDVVVRYLRSRPGPSGGGNTDAITINAGSSNVIVDHCSTSFSTDSLIDVTGDNEKQDRMVTVQNCILAWPLDRNNHWEDENGNVVDPPADPENPPQGVTLNNHGYGSLVRIGYSARVTFWRNLYAHCRGRCPRPGTWQNAQDDPDGMQLDFVNNVVFAWGDEVGFNQSSGDNVETHAGYDDSSTGAGSYNFVKNYYRGRLDADWGEKKFFRIKNPQAKGWFEGNRIKLPPENGPTTPTDQFDDLYITYGGSASRQTFEASAAFGSGDFEVPVQGQPTAEQSVRANAGASLKRDTLDALLLDDTITNDGSTTSGGVYNSRTGGLIDTPSEAGGWPALATTTPPEDSDRDGIPDDEEPEPAAVGAFDLQNDPRNAQLDDDGDGLTNLEDFLSEIVKPSTP